MGSKNHEKEEIKVDTILTKGSKQYRDQVVKGGRGSRLRQYRDYIDTMDNLGKTDCALTTFLIILIKETDVDNNLDELSGRLENLATGIVYVNGISLEALAKALKKRNIIMDGGDARVSGIVKGWWYKYLIILKIILGGIKTIGPIIPLKGSSKTLPQYRVRNWPILSDYKSLELSTPPYDTQATNQTSLGGNEKSSFTLQLFITNRLVKGELTQSIRGIIAYSEGGYDWGFLTKYHREDKTERD